MKGQRKRTHRVEVAMNDKEYERFIHNVQLCGLSQQSYLLHLISDRIPQPRPSDDFQEVIRQLRRIGTNINQLSVIANKTGSIDVMKFKRAIEELDHQIVEIRKQVYLPREVVYGNNSDLGYKG